MSYQFFFIKPSSPPCSQFPLLFPLSTVLRFSGPSPVCLFLLPCFVILCFFLHVCARLGIECGVDVSFVDRSAACRVVFIGWISSPSSESLRRVFIFLQVVLYFAAVHIFCSIPHYNWSSCYWAVSDCRVPPASEHPSGEFHLLHVCARLGIECGLMFHLSISPWFSAVGSSVDSPLPFWIRWRVFYLSACCVVLCRRS